MPRSAPRRLLIELQQFASAAYVASGTKQTCSMRSTNVRFWGQSGHNQPLLTNLDL